MEIPTPSNPLGWVAWLIAFMLAFAFGFMTVEPDRAVRPGPSDRVPPIIASGSAHVIETVEVSQPEAGKVMLSVMGYQPDGCDAPVEIQQTREENMVYISIVRNLPADAVCTDMIVAYAEDIPLTDEFEPGLYTFTVNNITVEKEIE